MRVVLIGNSQTLRTRTSQYLVKNHGFKSKRMAEDLYSFIGKMIGREKYNYKIKWESLITFYDAIYKVDPTLWVGHMEKRLRMSSDDSNIVIDDARFVSEVQKLRELGCVIVRIQLNQASVQHLYKNVGKLSGTAIIDEWFGEKSPADITIEMSHRPSECKPQLELLGKYLTTRKIS